MPVAAPEIEKSRIALDAWVRELMQWHFSPDTGCPFWLNWAAKASWDPRTEIKGYADLDRFGEFQDEWLRGGPVRRWVPKGFAGQPVYTFETGGSTGVPKSRINITDFRTDYERFSGTLPDDKFPKGADWLMIGPSGPRRLRLAVEHLAQYRGGICFMVDLDPRWVIKLIKMGEMEMMDLYKRHVIDQALTHLKAHDGIKCLFTTPKLLEALCERISLKKAGITGVFCGGTEMTPQFHRFAVEELMEGAYFAPTYGNTLMGLATHKPAIKEDNWAVIYYPPLPKAMIEVVDPDQPTRLVGYGETGRVRLTTLSKEFFMPRFLERDEAEREPPCDLYPWDGVRNVRPFSRFQKSVVEGVVLTMLHLPILRWGQPYRSVTQVVTPHFRTREPFVSMSQANVGIISRDLLRQADARRRLQSIAIADLITMAARAGDHFLNGTLPLDPADGSMQSPQDYVEQVSATTGMPWSNVRRNMAKVHGVLTKVEEVLLGLTRGMDLSVLDEGIGQTRGQMVSYFPRTEALGVVLPSNSPGVHSLWAPATVLKMPLVLKPGSAEPWTPLRIIQSWIAAGAPPEVFGYYPTDHAGGHAILQACGRGMVFGDVGSTKRWKSDPRVEVHGPGYSKVVIGPDVADEWEKYLDVMVESISNNGGRSCVNASGVWVTRHGDAIAQALAERMTRVVPRAADDPAAVLAPFADPDTARRIAAMIDDDAGGTMTPIGIATEHGGTYLLPAVVRCDVDHALANREFLFPFASVVQVPANDLPDCLGPSLVVTCISNDPAFRARFVASPHVDRLNFGAIPTTQIGWDQPHEGNLFEHLYARRAIQKLA